MDQKLFDSMLFNHARWLNAKKNKKRIPEGAKRMELNGVDFQRGKISLYAANLSRVRFYRCVLPFSMIFVTLRNAEFIHCYMENSYFEHAVLDDADLTLSSLPNPTSLLTADWGGVSNGLTKDLMTYDAACHPNPDKFNEWAKGGACPYSRLKINRACNFHQSRSLWDSKNTLKRPMDLLIRLFKEKNIKHNILV